MRSLFKAALIWAACGIKSANFTLELLNLSSKAALLCIPADLDLGTRTKIHTALTGLLRKMRATDKWADWLFIGTENVAAATATGCSRARASPNSFSNSFAEKSLFCIVRCLQKRKKQSKMNESNGRQQLCLKWNNHYHAIQYNFETLLQTEDFADVTLATEGQHIRAHKIVLSSCSPLFQVC